MVFFEQEEELSNWKDRPTSGVLMSFGRYLPVSPDPPN